MSDIPEDIENKAERLVGEWFNGPFGFSDLQDAIASAILAERERCAQIAALFIINGNSIHPDVPFERIAEGVKNIAHTTCQHIASAIRSPERAGE